MYLMLGFSLLFAPKWPLVVVPPEECCHASIKLNGMSAVAIEIRMDYELARPDDLWLALALTRKLHHVWNWAYLRSRKSCWTLVSLDRKMVFTELLIDDNWPVLELPWPVVVVSE